MKTITIKSKGLGRYDDVSPFIIADGKLEFKINIPVNNGQFFFIAENNGTLFKKYIREDGIINLDGLTAGELKAEVKHYIRGELIECYKIEPLLLRVVDCNLLGTPEITALQAESDALKKSLKETITSVEKLNAIVTALLRFAYADYKLNVYLSGGSVDDFLKEFDIELSEEERKEIFSKE